MSTQVRSGPLALRGFLPAWDIERRRVDVEPIVDWALAQLRERAPAIRDLETVHEHLDNRSAEAAAQALTAASVDVGFRLTLHRILARLLPELPLERVWVQTYAHFRVLLPGEALGPVPPHTDFGIGHSLHERNLWFALTDARGPAALHLAPLAPSLEWAARAGRVREVSADAPPLLPLEVERGEVLLFTPLHLHGARPPRGRTRVSLDLRLRPPLVAARDFTFSPLVGVP